MNLDVLRLYEHDYLSGRISSADIEALGDLRLPEGYQSLDMRFLSQLCYRSPCEQESFQVHKSLIFRNFEKKDTGIIRTFLQAFDIEIMQGKISPMPAKHYCIVAEEERKVLGGIWYYFSQQSNQKELFIHRLYVQTYARGRDIGKNLVEHVLERNKESCQLAFVVAPDFVADFYRGLGFYGKYSFRDKDLGKQKFYFMQKSL